MVVPCCLSILYVVVCIYWASIMAQIVKNPPPMLETQLWSLGQPATFQSPLFYFFCWICLFFKESVNEWIYNLAYFSPLLLACFLVLLQITIQRIKLQFCFKEHFQEMKYLKWYLYLFFQLFQENRR